MASAEAMVEGSKAGVKATNAEFSPLEHPDWGKTPLLSLEPPSSWEPGRGG